MALLPLLVGLAIGQRIATPTATVPFRIAEDAIIVDATVNSKNVSLMFDTGFAAAINVNDNINLGKPTGTMNLQDFVRTFQVPTVKITSLKLGNQSIPTKDLPEAVLMPGDSTSSYGMHCDGIMGFSVIKDNITGINYEHSRFEFYPKTVDISTWVPDNKRTFLCKLLPTGESSMQISVETPSGKRLVMALDTGNAFYATTHKDSLERVGLWDAVASPKFMQQAMVASGAVDTWKIRLKDMKIFGVPVASAIWDVIDLPASSADGDGTIGYGFLHNFNIIVDYERRRVWLENFTGKAANEEVGEPGMAAIGTRNGDAKIFFITPDSPAQKAGIKEGDSILSIDGTDIAPRATYRQLRKLLEGPVGSKMKIAISQGGQLKRLELERQALYNDPVSK